ncbi:MAG: rhodanese-like domain-containing protein [Fibrobacter sp.]|nr:rhodanese-like domain-containing protein [Fibrobacter sp.]
MDLIVYLVVAVSIVGITLFFSRRAVKGITLVSVQSVRDLLDESELLILDVRSMEEYAVGHLKKSKNIPVQSLSLKIASLLDWKDKKVLVYCHSGGRSMAASQMLKKSGFTKIYNMTGGVSAWVGMGNKLVK